MDRWRYIEKNIQSLKDNQNEAVKDIKEASKERVETYLKDKTRKIDAVDSRVSGLIEEHPWIAAITENELVPKVMSCRIVLITAEKFLEEGKVGLLYEYLYSAVRSDDDSQSKLEGTLDDYLDLVNFCDHKLEDDYLGYLIFSICYKNSGNSILISPDYLIRLIRFNNYGSAIRVSKQVKKAVFTKWWGKIFPKSEYDALANRKRFVLRGLISLSLFEAFSGKEKESERILARATSLAKSRTEDLISVQCANAERQAILGNYIEAADVLSDIQMDDIDDGHFNSISRISQVIGKPIQPSSNGKFSNENIQKGRINNLDKSNLQPNSKMSDETPSSQHLAQPSKKIVREEAKSADNKDSKQI
jgi:hypothetical protein